MNEKRTDLDALIADLRTERTYWTGQPARSLRELLAKAADALAERKTSETVPRGQYNEQVRLVARMDESEKAVASTLAAERARADALALIIERLRNTGGDPIDAIWARWRSIFTETDTKAMLAAHDAEVKAQALDEYAASLPLGHTRDDLAGRSRRLRRRAMAIRGGTK